MSRASDLLAGLEDVKRRLASACGRAGRSAESVTLVAVSKTCSAEDIRVLYEAGHRDFGENYVQEWEGKVEALPEDIRWHFIGGLQSRKAKLVVNRVALIQGVDRLSLAESISKRASGPQRVLIQINTGNDAAKGGVEPADALAFSAECQALPNLVVSGLMTIPPFDADEVQLRTYFSQMRGLYEALQAENPQVDTLSMGMTSDFEWAIEEGATMVRVGTAIFGRRSAK